MAPKHTLSLRASSERLGVGPVSWRVPSTPLRAVSHPLVTLEPDGEAREHAYPADR